MAVSYSKDDPSFNNHAANDSGLPPLSATVPLQAQLASVPSGVDVLYYIHRPDHNPFSIVSLSVISVDGLCHLLSLTKLPICSDTIVASNSFMMVTFMLDPSPLSNLSLVINLVMKSLTNYLIHLTLSAWALPSQASHLLTSLTISMSAASIFERKTVSSLTHANTPPPRRSLNHFSTAPSAFGSPLIKIGLTHILLIQSCQQLLGSSRTLVSSPTNHLRNPNSTPIII